MKFYKIPGYKNHQISKCGKIKNIRLNKFLEPWVENGYYRIGLFKNGKQTFFYMHRILGLVFLSNPKATINHIDGNKLNNKLNNLEWASYQENMSHSFRTKIRVPPVGENNKTSKLKLNQVREIRELLRNKKLSQTAIAKKFRVSRGCILGIYTQKTWQNG